jgi:DNA ligase-1
MKFEEFTTYAEQIEEESSDNEKIFLVAKMFSEASSSNISITARFIQGKLFPEWKDTKIKVGPATMYKALAQSTSSTREEVEEKVAEAGGVGESCELLEFSGSSDGQQKLPALGEDKSLTVQDVEETIYDIATISGSGSEKRKIQALSNVILDCKTSNEAKYFTRLVLGEMRIGVGEGTVRDAIAKAFDIDTEIVEKGLMVRNDVGEIAQIAKDGLTGELESLSVTLGRPVKSMLAQASEIETAFDDSVSQNETEEVIVDYKYDGSRLQIHKEGEDITLFTRNFENVTASLPDVVDRVREDVTVENVILDAEVVAYELQEDGTLGPPLPFQEVMRRVGRKHDIDEMANEIHVEVQVFDILFRESEELLDVPLQQRRKELSKVCSDIIAPYWFETDEASLREHKRSAIKDGNEGIMIKNPQSKYSPGNRGKEWLKLKPDSEPLDCVVIGGEWGEGRRKNLIGTYQLAVRDDNGQLKSIGKVATGITDEKLETLTELFSDKITKEQGKDLQFKPEIVFEVEYEEIQPSPKYNSGYALRFPRFIRIRDDKEPDTADTISRIENLT